MRGPCRYVTGLSSWHIPSQTRLKQYAGLQLSRKSLLVASLKEGMACWNQILDNFPGLL